MPTIIITNKRIIVLVIEQGKISNDIVAVNEEFFII